MSTPTSRFLRTTAASPAAFFGEGDSGKDTCTDPTVTGTPEVVVCQNGVGVLALDGTDVDDDSEVVLSDGTNEYRSTSVTVSADGTHLGAQMPPGVPPGASYDVQVENRSCTAAEPPMQVVPASGLVVFLPGPDVPHDGITTAITVYATSMRQPLPSDRVVITPHGSTPGGTTLAWQPVPNRPNRVQVTLPAGQAVGVYGLTVTDASGGQSTIDTALTVTGTTTRRRTSRTVAPDTASAPRTTASSRSVARAELPRPARRPRRSRRPRRASRPTAGTTKASRWCTCAI